MSRRTKAVLITATCILLSCNGHDPERVDISDVDLVVQIERLDRDLFGAPPDSMRNASLMGYADYGEFYRTYIEAILQGAPLEDPRLPAVLKGFVNDPNWRSVQLAIDSVLNDLEPQRAEFEDAFKRLKVLFPDSITPRLIAFNSGYNFGIYPTDSVLGIGLEWFIGKEHPVIGYLAPEAFPQFVKDRMMPEMLVPSALKGWLLVHYTRDIRGADVLTNLVETGKIMALLEAILPGSEPSVRFAFSPEQLAWCEANEFMIWRDIVSSEMLFSKKTMDIGRLMNDAPFTSGLPRESPGHIGEWIGYRMVSEYLERNPGNDFEALFANDDPRVILKYYKPR